MGNADSLPEDSSSARGFPGSAILENFQCGNLDDAEDSPYKNKNGLSKFFSQADGFCTSSPSAEGFGNNRTHFDGEYEEFRKDMDDDDDIVASSNKGRSSSSTPANPTSALFARALVNEVTNNPNTMTPAAMAERETKLLKAQNKARQRQTVESGGAKPVGAPGGIGQPSVLGSIAHALTGTTDPLGDGVGSVMPSGEKSSVLPPNSMSENRAQVDSNLPEAIHGKHTVTIGLSLTRRSSAGHQDTVTRQTAFDFNELQDRDYKYVSSTDSSGWRAGGGERGGRQTTSDFDDDEYEGNMPFNKPVNSPAGKGAAGTPTSTAQNYKVAAPDSTHIPILHIDCDSPQEVDAIIAALARGEVFIPHMAIIPEALSVNGVSPPDLVVRFGTERNEDLPPDEWPNWCLEFMHNQLYEYFHGMGARWMKRPFSITLAKKVRWKTVKHMNRYFAHAERVIDAWREKGPQYLDPQLAYIEGGATPEEVARPHGIYLLRNGVPTNYFAPNFDPPYTTKMTRSLLLNVLGKSWDKKRREWTSAPMPRLITPSMLVTAMCGCGDNSGGGFMANEVTLVSNINTSNIPDGSTIRSDPMTPAKRLPKRQQQQPPQQQTQQQSEFDTADTDIVSEPVYKGGQMNTPSQQRTPTQQSDIRQSFDDRRPAFSKKNDPINTPSQQSELRGSFEEQRRPMNTPSQQSELRNSFEEQRPVDPSGVSENDENNRSRSQRSAMSGKHPNKSDVPELDIILSSTGSIGSGGASKHSASSTFSSRAKSPKYGRAPTPERKRVLSPSPRHAQNEADEMVDTDRTGPRTPDPAGTAEMDHSINSRAPSDYGQTSQTGTGTTVMHMNLSAEKFMRRDMDRRQQAREEKKEEDVRDGDGHGPLPHLSSDEDWLDDLGKPMQSPAVSAHGAKTPKQGKNSKHNNSSIDKERAEEKTDQSYAYLPRTLNDPAKMGETVIGSERTRNKQKVRTPSIHKTDSGTVSLEYSVDSNSIMGENSYMGDSSALASLMGQHYATDTSVLTTASSAISTKGSGGQQSNSRQTAPVSENEDEDVSGFSIQESTSSMEAIPTDEELFAVGWAKALDPSSGSYYYFTLDRTKTVWENPLANGGSADSAEDESIPVGAVSI